MEVFATYYLLKHSIPIYIIDKIIKMAKHEEIEENQRNKIIAYWYIRGSGLRDGKYYTQLCLRCLEEFLLIGDDVYDVMCQSCGKIVCEDCSKFKHCNECDFGWRCCKGECFLEKNDCNC